MVADPLSGQLEELSDLLGQMCTSAAGSMRIATAALLEGRERLAVQAIARTAAMDALRVGVERVASSALLHHAPKAGDLRAVVSAIRTASDIERMGVLARHVAETVERRHPDHALPPEVRGDFTEMGAVAVRLALKAAEVVRSRNVIMAVELDTDDDAIDILHQHMFGVLMDPSWPHGVTSAVDVTLLARYYERFADHAVVVARETVYAVTGKTPDTLAI